MSKLIGYLPNYYRTSEVMAGLTASEDSELSLFRSRLIETLNQFFVDMATTSLSRWEKEIGIPVNEFKTAEYRRSVIKSKLRGSGTVTVNFIKNVAASFSNGSVEVIEDNPNSSFTIKFVGTIGIPPNLEDLKAAIEDIKPAHLLAEFEVQYNTYARLSEFTYAQLAAYTNDQLRNEVII